MSTDRYRAVGLACNPFAIELQIERGAELFVERGLPVPAAAGSAALVQVIGDRGYGKTTQLMQWRRQAPGPYHYVEREPYWRRWQRPPIAGLVYADEVDRLPLPLRWQWFRRAAAQSATLVIGTHEDLAGAATRAGLRVTTHRFDSLTLPLLQQVIAKRWHAARAEGSRAAPLQLSAEQVSHIFAQSNGSLRQAEIVGHTLVADLVA